MCFLYFELGQNHKKFFKEKTYCVVWDVHMIFCRQLTFSQQVTAKNQNIILCIFQLRPGVIMYLISDHQDVSKKVLRW